MGELETCSACRFWRPTPTLADGRPRQRILWANQRECRRFPPTDADFAISFSSDWCGEFRPLPPGGSAMTSDPADNSADLKKMDEVKEVVERLTSAVANEWNPLDGYNSEDHVAASDAMQEDVEALVAHLSRQEAEIAGLTGAKSSALCETCRGAGLWRGGGCPVCNGRGRVPHPLAGLSAEQRAEVEAHIRGLTDPAPTYQGPKHGWTCFHCGETFLTAEGARLHFGREVTGRPACYPALASQSAAVSGLVEAGRAAVTFYDRAELPHMPGEAKVLDALSAALAQVEEAGEL